MSKTNHTLDSIRLLDDLSMKKTIVHQLHPLPKLLTTIVFLVVVVSFGRYEITSLLPFLFYPIITIALAELPLLPILKRVLLVMPFVIGIGIFNPLFDDQSIVMAGITISRGWMTFMSICIKFGFTVSASIILIATTGMDKIAAALRILKVPSIFVLQLLLTYRYIAVLVEEVSRMHRAYSLRAPAQKGINRSDWGSFAGQLILRTYERAQRVFQAMNLRGFSGEYNVGNLHPIMRKDIVYLITWCSFFVLARIYNLPMIIEVFLIGVK